MQFQFRTVSSFHVVPAPFQDQSHCLSPGCAHVEWNVVWSGRGAGFDGGGAESYAGSGCVENRTVGTGSGGSGGKIERGRRKSGEGAEVAVEIAAVAAGQWG